MLDCFFEVSEMTSEFTVGDSFSHCSIHKVSDYETIRVINITAKLCQRSQRLRATRTCNFEKFSNCIYFE